MFSVVEFAGSSLGESIRELAVVPSIWLQRNETKCYWPVKTNKMSFEEFVKTNTMFRKSWPMYKILRVHFKSSEYEEAEQKLLSLLQPAQQTDTTDLNQSFVIKSPINTEESSSEEESSTSNKRHLPIDSIDRANESLMKKKKISDEISNKTTLSTSTITISPSTSSQETLTPFREETPTSYLSQFPVSSNKILNLLSKISTDVENNSVMLRELIHFNNLQSAKLTAPGNVPKEFPIKTVDHFQKFDTDLGEDAILRQYMVRRLAALGGSDIDSLTRRMLRFLISDEVGMSYNWKGHEKLPFQRTNVIKIIYEAGKINFPVQEQSDHKIETRVKEWLKMSKSRLQRKSK